MFKLYGRYKLKNGEIGRAVDILGDGEACIFEFEKRNLEDSVDTVFWKDVEEELRQYHQSEMAGGIFIKDT